MLSSLNNNFRTNHTFGAGRPQGPGADAPPAQALQALAASLLSRLQDSAQLGGGAEGGGCSGGCPVNFGSWGGGGSNASASASANGALGNAWGNTAGGGGMPPIIVVNGGGGSSAPPAEGGTTTNNGTGTQGSPNVTINAKKIKNSNIIVNGQNVTATAGKKNKA